MLLLTTHGRQDGDNSRVSIVNGSPANCVVFCPKDKFYKSPCALLHSSVKKHQLHLDGHKYKFFNIPCI